MPIRHRSNFTEALSILRRFKNAEDQAYYQNWQSSSSSWWNWQDSWWHSSSEYHRNDGPSIDRSGKPERLHEDIRVQHAHDGTGESVKSSESTHIVKEQFGPEENRDIASFNADNEFNRAVDEENIDFNIPGVPISTETITWRQRSKFDSEDREPQSDLQQHRQLILSAKNHKMCDESSGKH